MLEITTAGTLTALIGAGAGWALKSTADLLSWKTKEWRLFRGVMFGLLRTYKAISDYDRATTYFRKEPVGIDIHEPTRAALEKIMLAETGRLGEGLAEAISLLGSVDPTFAFELDRALLRLRNTFNGRLQVTAMKKHADAQYVDLLDLSDRIVATALLVLQTALRKVAWRAGIIQYVKIRLWLRNHLGRGEKEWEDGMDSQKSIREEQRGLGTAAYAEDWNRSVSGHDSAQPTE